MTTLHSLAVERKIREMRLDRAKFIAMAERNESVTLPAATVVALFDNIEKLAVLASSVPLPEAE